MTPAAVRCLFETHISFASTVKYIALTNLRWYVQLSQIAAD